MKTKIRIVSLLALGLVAAASLVRAAEPPAGPPPAERGPRPDGMRMREHRMQVLEEKLQLTAAQKQQIQTIWDQAEQQGQALRASEVQAREDRRQKMMEIMKATHAQVRAVLTPDQQKTFDTLPPEGRGRRGPRPGGEGKPAEAPPPPSQ